MSPRFATLAACCGAFCFTSLYAQNPVTSATQRLATRAARNLIGAAEEMPADKYDYKPTAAQMTFGEVVVHLVEGNREMCGWVSGTTPAQPAKVTPQDTKETLVPQLKQSFDFCSTALSGVDDSKLADSVPFFGGKKVTRALAMLVLIDDWADHYSQVAIYLRLNGLLPPTAKKKEG